MNIPKRYNPKTAEPHLQSWWQEKGTYHFNSRASEPDCVIDIPPPTVSGHLHLGHVYSYSHADFVARFWRMNGYNVLYPMGYDDNGLPTERLVERRLNVRAQELGRGRFIEKCLEISQEAEKDYEALWKRLALSIDWRYTYRTIDTRSRRLSQLSFIDLYQKNLAYRQKAPTIWCPECQTAIAQAELDDIERESEYINLNFVVDNGLTLPIATTRPELLPACVAVFVHPEDMRYQEFIGHQISVPLFGQVVPVMADAEADPEKGTGVVMCCTFGDSTDVAWWYTHQLSLVEAIGRDGTMTEAAGQFSGLPVTVARQQIKKALEEAGLVTGRYPTEQAIRVHERCDTPIEFIITSQWFIRVMDYKEKFLAAGDHIAWYPDHMRNRYRQWVENLNWDWCISRQRYYGVPFPAWYCADCGDVMLAQENELPIDPTESQPERACDCGSTEFLPEKDVMDTWATSSLTPQLVGRMLSRSGFDGESFQPVSMRTQAHEIIRTWAFYSIVKSHHHFGKIPWRDAVISGWGLSPEGSSKISKSRGGGPVTPMEMIDRYSADAVRYWAASTGLGKDAIISEERVQAGVKLVRKLWNVARFSQRFLTGYSPPGSMPELSPADRWILSRHHQLIRQVTNAFFEYDYASAKSLIEAFFWNEMADNYLEMCKKRLYDDADPLREGARFTLHQLLLNIVKMFAPLLPHVTEAVFSGLFETNRANNSVHRQKWPEVDENLIDEEFDEIGELLVEIATAVRRYKSQNNLSLSSELPELNLATADGYLTRMLRLANSDLISITRAKVISVTVTPEAKQHILSDEGRIVISL